MEHGKHGLCADRGALPSPQGSTWESRLSYQHRGFELHALVLHSCRTCPLRGARAGLFSLVKYKMLCFVGRLGEWTSHGELVGSALSTGTADTDTLVCSQIQPQQEGGGLTVCTEDAVEAAEPGAAPAYPCTLYPWALHLQICSMGHGPENSLPQAGGCVSLFSQAGKDAVAASCHIISTG